MTVPPYPLMEHAQDQVHALSGRALREITLETELTAADLRIHADTLRYQAEIAREAGNDQLAANLLRAAELTLVPNEEVLKIYELLRPGRASWEQLNQLAQHLENTYHAAENARFIREAADIYRERGLLRR